MYRQYSFLLTLPLLFLIGVLYMLDDGNSTQDSSEPINAVIGDESFIRMYGHEPGEDIPDVVRIRTHLEYVEGILRNRPVDHLPDPQKENRQKLLDLLRDYIATGEYPSNDGHPDSRRPVFISENGTICAVGYLVEQTAGRKVAEIVNREHKYDYISDIDHPAFLKWVEESGFTPEELAMIQPAYRPVVVEQTTRNRNRIRPSYGIGFSLLTGANVLYYSNSSGHPWMFGSAQSNHWYGLATGTGAVLFGVLNVGNTRSTFESINPNAVYDPSTGMCSMGCPLREVTETNHVRTAMAAATIGMGAFSLARAGYHLLNGTEPEEKRVSQPSGFEIKPVMINGRGEPVPVLRYTHRF